MEIKRDLYLQRIINRKHNGMIKVITGIRRCGKSYLLFTLFKNHLISSGVKIDHIIELNLDDIGNKKYRNPDELYSFVKNQIKDTEMYYILLDEVQFVPGFEEVLNGFLHINNADTYVTGSNAKFLSKDIITEFRGRGDQIHISPLSFSEYYSVNKGDKVKALNEYMTYGGLPQIATMVTHEQKASYLINLFKEVYIVDIVNRNKVSNEVELNELIDILSSSIGSLISSNKLCNTFKSIKNITLSAPTISKYLDYLEDSFIVSKAERYDIKGKRYINSPLKYYFTDLGLRNARINFRQSEYTHLFENVIYNELITRGYNVDVGAVAANEINNKGNSCLKQLEIDFVCNNADERLYIQSAYSIEDIQKYHQESKPLILVKDSFKKMIITFDYVVTHYTDDGILIMNVFDFLLGK